MRRRKKVWQFCIWGGKCYVSVILAIGNNETYVKLPTWRHGKLEWNFLFHSHVKGKIIVEKSFELFYFGTCEKTLAIIIALEETAWLNLLSILPSASLSANLEISLRLWMLEEAESLSFSVCCKYRTQTRLISIHKFWSQPPINSPALRLCPKRTGNKVVLPSCSCCFSAI